MVCFYPNVMIDDPYYKERTHSNRLRFVGTLKHNLFSNIITDYDSAIERLENVIKWHVDAATGEIFKPYLVPCGHCIGCRLDNSLQWAVRCQNEAMMYDSSLFITLTYNDIQLPRNGSLVKEHLSSFIKNFRYKFGKNIKFFGCGEYGSLNNRPHYHLILFNTEFNDLEYFKAVNGYRYYTSCRLNDIWKKGYTIVGNACFESAAYVARYVTKKIYGEPARNHYGQRVPEFQVQSLRPGIGYAFFKKYYHDIYDVYDKVVCSNGLKIKPPRYYDKLLQIENPILYDKIKKSRLERAMSMAVDNLREERFFARETIQKARFQRLIRSYENLN